MISGYGILEHTTVAIFVPCFLYLFQKHLIHIKTSNMFFWSQASDIAHLQPASRSEPQELLRLSKPKGETAGCLEPSVVIHSPVAGWPSASAACQGHHFPHLHSHGSWELVEIILLLPESKNSENNMFLRHFVVSAAC